ncbi:MAG: hypothetical protein QNI98_11635 [Woeseiaceae bacterium]|nr:hypothetical protein [Woeseiaceae bacterium]
MRFFKILAVLTLLAVSGAAAADAGSVPGNANWYFHVDLKQMRSGGPGVAMYDWLRDEVMSEIRDDAGIDVEKEVDRVTSYATGDDGAVLIVDGKLSQETRDKIMAFIAAGGDITPLKSKGKTYYHFGGNEELDEDIVYEAGNIGLQVESLGEESWVSMAVKNKVIITSTEGHMQELLASNGKVKGTRSVDDALMVLTAEKTLVQAGMKSGMLGEGDWDSNILRNTEQVAFLISAAANKLAFEAKLITTEAEMAESLASVARGLISLVMFDEELEPEVAAALQGTRVEAKGNNLSISVALDPELVVQTLGE